MVSTNPEYRGLLSSTDLLPGKSQIANTGTTSDSGGDTSDPVIGTFISRLKRFKVQGAVVRVTVENGAYRIHTDVDSKSAAALDRVYRAEAATEQEVRKSAFGSAKILLIFSHRNVALEPGNESEDELPDGSYALINV